MEKLIELLNEYEKWKWEEYWRWNYVWWIDKENKNIFASRFPDWAYICEEESRAIIICKGYEFIKRLVDNDKIDFYNILKENWKFRKEFYAIENKNEYERLIILLSVEDNPIEFLVSVLK